MNCFKKFLLSILCICFTVSVFAEKNTKQNIADWNFIVYLVSNNDLERFALQNINEMIKVGSNQNINILIQVDTHGKDESCRYLINKDDPVLVEKQSNNYQSLSGTPENLFGCVRWAITHFPAKYQAIILWDHGSGIEDPHVFGKFKINYPHDIFTFNKKSGLIELNRKLVSKKGIGFNEVFQTYLTNQDVLECMQKISKELLHGKKIDILGMDACFMSMVEIASQVRDYVKIIVGSQEVEPGTGWKYDKVLEPFIDISLSPRDFAKHIVRSYKQAYQNTYTDYTLSAINLKNHLSLENNINAVSKVLIFNLKHKDQKVFKKAISRIRNSSNLTTSFTNKNYIDLYHFYVSLLDACYIIENSVIFKDSVILLKSLLEEGLKIMDNSILKKVCCNKLSTAHGLSIYFPINIIHDSYYKTLFSKETEWIKFLEKYIAN